MAIKYSNYKNYSDYKSYNKKSTQQKKELTEVNSFSSDSNRIQTCNLRIRSAMLYSVELWSRYFSFASAKVQHFFKIPKLFRTFLSYFLQLTNNKIIICSFFTVNYHKIPKKRLKKHCQMTSKTKNLNLFFLIFRKNS